MLTQHRAGLEKTVADQRGAQEEWRASLVSSIEHMEKELRKTIGQLAEEQHSHQAHFRNISDQFGSRLESERIARENQVSSSMAQASQMKFLESSLREECNSLLQSQVQSLELRLRQDIARQQLDSPALCVAQSSRAKSLPLAPDGREAAQLLERHREFQAEIRSEAERGGARLRDLVMQHRAEIEARLGGDLARLAEQQKQDCLRLQESCAQSKAEHAGAVQDLRTEVGGLAVNHQGILELAASLREEVAGLASGQSAVSSAASLREEVVRLSTRSDRVDVELADVRASQAAALQQIREVCADHASQGKIDKERMEGALDLLRGELAMERAMAAERAHLEKFEKERLQAMRQTPDRAMQIDAADMDAQLRAEVAKAVDSRLPSVQVDMAGSATKAAPSNNRNMPLAAADRFPRQPSSEHLSLAESARAHGAGGLAGEGAAVRQGPSPSTGPANSQQPASQVVMGGSLSASLSSSMKRGALSYEAPAVNEGHGQRVHPATAHALQPAMPSTPYGLGRPHTGGSTTARSLAASMATPRLTSLEVPCSRPSLAGPSRSVTPQPPSPLRASRGVPPIGWRPQ